MSTLCKLEIRGIRSFGVDDSQVYVQIFNVLIERIFKFYFLSEIKIPFPFNFDCGAKWLWKNYDN